MQGSQHDPPPPYTSQENFDLDAPPQHEGFPSSVHNFDTIQQHILLLKHTYELRTNESHTAIVHHGTGQTLFNAYTNNTDVNVEADIVLYRDNTAADAKPQRLAQAKISRTEDASLTSGIAIYLGSELTPPAVAAGANAWIPIRYSRERDSFIHKIDRYRFEVAGKPLAWQRNHAEQFKLLDETHVGEWALQHNAQVATAGRIVVGGDEIARFGGKEQRVEWDDEFGDEVEAGALIVLLGILEVGRRELVQRREGSRFGRLRKGSLC